MTIFTGQDAYTHLGSFHEKVRLGKLPTKVTFSDFSLESFFCQTPIMLGNSLDDFLGYALCKIMQPKDVFNLGSLLPGLKYDQITKKSFGIHVFVDRDDIRKKRPYLDYQGVKPLLYIQSIEMYERGCGYGSTLLDFIKTQAELIEIEVNKKNKDALRFFQKHGFKKQNLWWGQAQILTWYHS